MSKKMYAYKVLVKGMVSDADNSFKWKKGKWYEHEGEISLCNSGFHASKNLIDAIWYVTPGIICKVEYSGEVIEVNDKFVASRMRVVETYRFTKRMAVEFSIFCAKSCYKNWTYYNKSDKSVLEAIQAAENWLKNPTKKNKNAAWSAAEFAAWSAESAAKSAKSAEFAAKSAWSAAWSAEFAAEFAAKSAKSAAESAAWSAEFAAWSAAEFAAWSAKSAAESAAKSAAEFAAESAAKKKMNKKLLKIIGGK